MSVESLSSMFSADRIVRAHQSAKLGYRIAVYSSDETERYILEIVWDPNGWVCMFTGLNPSTATERVDDPTVRRCIGFAKSWGAGALRMTNLVPFRSTDPKPMLKHVESIAADARAMFDWRESNAAMLSRMAHRCDVVVAAWGTNVSSSPEMTALATAVTRRLSNQGKRVVCLGRNADGTPKHPLYVKKTQGWVEYGHAGALCW
jgi:hypothetical protein